MNPYYVAPNDQQQGPYSMAQLQAMLDGGTLQPTDLCWREGMADWQSIGTALPGLLMFSAHGSSVPSRLTPEYVQLQAPREYGGIGRTAFALMWVGLWFAAELLFSRFEDERTLVQCIAGISILLTVILIIQRLGNTGQSPWILLLIFVPVLNIVLLIALPYYLLLAPEGYAQSKKLDSGAKKILWLLGAGIAAIILYQGYFYLIKATPLFFSK